MGVWFSMDFSCNMEENDMSYASQASEQLSRMPEAPGVEYGCLTRSRTSPNTVACTSFVVRDTPKLNHVAGPLPFVEDRLTFKGTVDVGPLFGDWNEGCEGDGVSGLGDFSSRRYEVLDPDRDSSAS